jgi:hypothetical protein
VKFPVGTAAILWCLFVLVVYDTPRRISERTQGQLDGTRVIQWHGLKIQCSQVLDLASARTGSFGACSLSASRPHSSACGRPPPLRGGAVPPTAWFEAALMILFFVIFRPLNRPALTRHWH